MTSAAAYMNKLLAVSRMFYWDKIYHNYQNYYAGLNAVGTTKNELPSLIEQ